MEEKRSNNTANYRSFTSVNGELTDEQVKQILVKNYKRLYEKYPYAEARRLVLQRLARHQESPSASSASSSSEIYNLSRSVSEITLEPTASNQPQSQRTTIPNHNIEASNHMQNFQSGTESPISAPIEYSVDLETISAEAKTPEYASIDARVESFSSWPSPDIQNSKTLAEAGFYFTGSDDRVRCFACDGGLCNWAREDVPLYEHAKWYGSCPYLIDCQRHPVVTAIIETCRTIDRLFRRLAHKHSSVSNAQEAPTSSHHHQHHHHHHHGSLQCDTEAASLLAAEQGPPEQSQIPETTNGSVNVQAESQDVTDETEEPQEQTSDVIVESEMPHAQNPDNSNNSETPDLKSVQRENEEMKSARMCKLCMESPVGVIFLPCSHLVCCIDCGLQVNTCPLCRGEIKATAKVYV